MAEGLGYVILFFILTAPLVYGLYQWTHEELSNRRKLE